MWRQLGIHHTCLAGQAACLYDRSKTSFGKLEPKSGGVLYLIEHCHAIEALDDGAE